MPDGKYIKRLSQIGWGVTGKFLEDIRRVMRRGKMFCQKFAASVWYPFAMSAEQKLLY